MLVRSSTALASYLGKFDLIVFFTVTFSHSTCYCAFAVCLVSTNLTSSFFLFITTIFLEFIS